VKRWYRTTTLHGITTWRWRQFGPLKRWYSTTILDSVTTWRWRQRGPPKRWYPNIKIQGVTTWRWRQRGPSKRCYPNIKIHGVTTWRGRQHGSPKRLYPNTQLYGITTWRWRQHGPSKLWYAATKLHGASFTPRPLYLPPRETAHHTHRTGGWVGPRAGLDAVVKRKIPSPCRDSNPQNENAVTAVNIMIFVKVVVNSLLISSELTNNTYRWRIVSFNWYRQLGDPSLCAV
jgi:hypothetical protein